MDDNWKNSKPSTSGIGEKGVNEDQEDDESDSSEDMYDDVASETSSSSSTSSSENCPICLNRLRKQIIGNPECCDHLFCFDCIFEWSNCTTTCPIDRLPFTSIITRDPETGKILKKEKVEIRAPQEELEEEEEGDSTECEVCRQSNREDRMLLCDACDRGYHLDCLTPPLDSVPLDAWFCPRCTVEDPPVAAPGRQRRAIPRTRANERLRARIANHRLIQYSDDSDEGVSEASNYDSDDGVLYSTPGETVTRKPARRRRRKRRYFPRKGTQRKSAKSSEKSRKGKPKRRRRRRRRKQASRRVSTALKRSNSDTNLARLRSGSRTKGADNKVKERLAQRLGILEPPKKGYHFPKVKAPPAPLEPAANAQVALFENRNALIGFSDENDVPEAQTRNEPIISDKARRFRSRLGPVKKNPKPPQGEPSTDLLGGILKGQELLLAPSSSVKIKRDGSLQGKTGSAVDRAKVGEGSGQVSKTATSSAKTAATSTGKKEVKKNTDPVVVDEEHEAARKGMETTKNGKREKDGISTNGETASKRRKLSDQDGTTTDVVPSMDVVPSTDVVPSSSVDVNWREKDHVKRETSQGKDSGKRSTSKSADGCNLQLPASDSMKREKTEERRGTPGESTSGKLETSKGAESGAGSYLQCIHPPPNEFPKPSPSRKKGPLLPSPLIPPTSTVVKNEPGRSTRSRQSFPLPEPDSIAPKADSTTPKHQVIQATSGSHRYAVPVSLPSSSTPPKTSDDTSLKQALITAQLQQNFFLQQQQQQQRLGEQLSPLLKEEMNQLLQQNDFHGSLPNTSAATGQLFLSAHQHHSAGSNDQPSMETLLSMGNSLPAFLTPPNLATAAVMQNALALAAARQQQQQQQFNLLSTLRAVSSHQRFPAGLIPAFATAGGALYPGMPPVWPQHLLTSQPPPPPAAPPPPPPPDLQLIPLPPPRFAVATTAVPPPPPPPVPPPASNIGRNEYEADGGRQPLDARLSELEMDNNVPPELMSLLQQFAQIKKEQQQPTSADFNGLRTYTDQCRRHFAPVPVSPASSTSPLIMDMVVTTPSPEPAEPTPAVTTDTGGKTKKTKGVKFGADVVEADERKVKLSKTEVKQKKREERLQKMLKDAKSGNAAQRNADDDGVPSSAQDLKRREKVLAKFNHQMQVEEAVKVALRPYYSKRKITKDQYKEIMRKCVPKVCKKKADIKPEKIKAFVDTCVAKVLSGKSRHDSFGDD